MISRGRTGIRTTRLLLAGTVAVLLVPSGMAGIALADSGTGTSQAIPDSAAVQPLLDGQMIVAPETVDSTTNAAGLCSLQQAGDYAHISSTAPRAASAHGWWYNTNCKATHAVVTVRLQKKGLLGVWSNVGTKGVATVKSGGGSGNRATSRYTCSGSSKHKFRSWVDVDVVGVADLPKKLYTPERELACN